MHYLNGDVPDEAFDRVTFGSAAHYPGAAATRNAAHRSTRTASSPCKKTILALVCSGTRVRSAEKRVSEGIRTPDPLDHNQVL